MVTVVTTWTVCVACRWDQHRRTCRPPDGCTVYHTDRGRTSPECCLQTIQFNSIRFKQHQSRLYRKNRHRSWQNNKSLQLHQILMGWMQRLSYFTSVTAKNVAPLCSAWNTPSNHRRLPRLSQSLPKMAYLSLLFIIEQRGSGRRSVIYPNEPTLLQPGLASWKDTFLRSSYPAKYCGARSQSSGLTFGPFSEWSINVK